MLFFDGSMTRIAMKGKQLMKIPAWNANVRKREKCN